MGNPITNELPQSLDNFLQDMCQMYCDMNYTDVSKFAKRATSDDITALRKLYRKFRKAAEYDDEDEIAELAVSVEDLVKGKGLTESEDEEDPFAAEKEGNPYIVGNCSLCGANGTDTVENFLKKNGFEDIEYCCDVLDIDPLEEVCEECFKSWLPDLNKAVYSEYDDLGTDTRTGLPFKESFVEGPGFSDNSHKVHRMKIKRILDKGSITYNEHSQALAYDVPIVTGNDVGWPDIEATKEFFEDRGLKVGFATVDGLYYYGFLQLEDEEAYAYLSQYSKSKDEDDDDWSDLKADILVCFTIGENKKSKKIVKESVRKVGKKPLKESHEWSDFDKFKNTDEYLPAMGDGDNKGTQAATALSKLIYKWFNDGDVFDNTYGLTGWANDISGSANWLYYYVPETQPILNRIKEIGSDEDAYTDLLYDLIALVDPQIPALSKFPKEGDAYGESGPFEFQEYQEEEEDDYDDYYEEEDYEDEEE